MNDFFQRHELSSVPQPIEAYGNPRLISNRYAIRSQDGPATTPRGRTFRSTQAANGRDVVANACYAVGALFRTKSAVNRLGREAPLPTDADHLFTVSWAEKRADGRAVAPTAVRGRQTCKLPWLALIAGVGFLTSFAFSFNESFRFEARLGGGSVRPRHWASLTVDRKST